MTRGFRSRSLAATLGAVVGLMAFGVGSAGAFRATSGALTRAFSLIDKPNSKAVTLVNTDGLLINARCNSRGQPVVFAFTSAASSDLLGRIFDGQGRIHIVHNTDFTKRTPGVALYPSSGDYDTTGTVLFEDISSRVVSVDYALDDSTTLSGRHVCTVYGTLTAT